MPVVTDVEVLAEDTAQVAAGEEYRARASPSDQDVFFAEMGPDGTDNRLGSDAAKSRLPLSTTGFALTWTEHTGIYRVPQPPDRFIGLIAHGRFM